MSLQAWQLRVIQERAELEERRAGVDAFIVTEAFQTISEKEQNLLLAQAQAMMDYSHVLTKRIGTFQEQVTI